MKQPMRRAILAVAVLGLITATTGQMRAGTVVDFSYSGRGGPDFAGLISSGTGSFSFASGLSTVSLGDLTAFEFTLNENTPNTTTFGLADLSSFSATVGPGTTLSNLALATGPVQGTNQESFPREFTVSSLGPNDASSSYVLLGVPFSLTDGTVTITSVTTTVPEPSAFSLAVIASLTSAGAWFCRRRARATACRG